MSLRSKAVLIFTIVALVYTGLLIGFMFYLTTTTLNLWENEDIEKGLVIGVNTPKDSLEQAQTEKALKTYRQLKGLKSLFEWQSVGFSILIGGLFFLLSILIIYLILFRITKPLSELAIALSKTGEGYLDIKIPKPDSEIAQVVNAYNEMTVQLKRSRERLKQAERIAAWRDAARIMAHEVRNPLTGIRLSIERLIKRFRNKDENLSNVLEKSSEMILSEISTLEKLAKEFSDFARLPSPILKPANLNDLINKIVAGYEDFSKDVNIKKELDLSISEIFLDKRLIRRVFLNLLNNSLDALGDKKGLIEVKTEKEKDKVIITFKDSGRGIEPEYINKVFDPYFTTKVKGTGLGLAIVKQIVNEHGGEVMIASEIGKGTEIIIILPSQEELTDVSGGGNV